MYETSDASGAVFTVAFLIGYFAVLVFYTAALWKVFTKAHQPGWHAVVPILSTYTLIKVAGRPGWWLWLMFIPCVSFVVLAIVLFDLADSFGRSPWFGAGLALLTPIFLPIVAFGSSAYLSGDPYDRRVALRAAYPTPTGGSWTPNAVTAAPSLPSLHGPPAGWYPAPEGTGGQRWWDGTDWTEHRAP